MPKSNAVHSFFIYIYYMLTYILPRVFILRLSLGNDKFLAVYVVVEKLLEVC